MEWVLVCAEFGVSVVAVADSEVEDENVERGC